MSHTTDIMRLDRLCFPIDRVPESTTPLFYPPIRLKYHYTHNRRPRSTARPPTTSYREGDLALRTRSLPNSKDKRHHSRTFLRHSGLLRDNMPRNARLRMAISLRCTRPA
jgi:hypothetical protein